MLSLSILFTLPLLAFANSPAEPPKPESNLKPFYSSPNEAFQDLLNALPEESLHAALVKSLDHFREGIFESDRHGVEHIHQDNPPLATKLIVEAVRDLKMKHKRQITNGTTAVAPDAQSTTAAVLIPVHVTTTDAQGRTTTASFDALSTPTASIAVPVTVTNAQGQTTVSTTTKPAVIHSTTNAAGSPVLSTAAVDFAPTAGEVLTTTNAQGSTFLTTYTPDGGKVSSIVIKTTTGADGKPTAVTSYTYVEPASATGTDATKTTAKPGLQTPGAASRGKKIDMAMIGGLGGLVAMFV